MSMLLILSWLVPLIAALLAPLSRFWWLPAIAAVPSLLAAAMLPLGSEVEIPWLLLGTVLGMNDVDRIFLAFTSLLWLAAGIYAAGSMRASAHGGRFRSYFLLAMAGNFWLIVGLDLVSFYVGFSLMGLASYGLVVHDGDRSALRAGKVYLVVTLLGELALFVALVLVAHHAGGLVPQRSELAGLGDVTVGLLILGLAIKAGLVPVHVWLPLAHPAAPVPASAVLSGAMIKVALLGWLRFLPIGEVALVEWGVFMLMVGLLTLFYAIPIGLVQSNLKVILAYSSVSKMGLMALTLGLILLEPGLASTGIVALCLYAAHHALVKGGLFLGVGLRHHAHAQVLVLAGTAVLALSLAGVPPSSGAVAKYGIKPTLAGTDWSWLTAAVSLSTAGTALLMARFIWVVWRTDPHPTHGQLLGGIGWAGLVVLSLLFPVLLGNPAGWVTNALPIGITLAIVAPIGLLTWRKRYLLRPAIDRVPAGDLLGLVRPVLVVTGYASRSFDRRWSRLVRSAARLSNTAVSALEPAPKDPERSLRRWPNVGTAWLVIMVLPLVFSLWTLPAIPPWEQPQVAVQEPAMPPHHAESAVPLEEFVRQPPVAKEAMAQAEAPAEVAVSEPPPAFRPAESSASDGRKPIDPQVTDEVASHAQPPVAGDPQGEPVEPLSVIAGELSVENSADSGSGDELCDPGQVLILGHAMFAEPLRLTNCVQSPDGPRRLVAPPLTNTLVAMVQRHLIDLGYDAGPVDGLIGPRTRRAVRLFQKDQGDAPTGAISFILIESILAASAPSVAADTADSHRRQ